MKRSRYACLVIAFVFVCMSLVSRPTRAQGQTTASASASMTLPVPTLVPNESDPGAVITPVQKGQKVPYSGTLLSPRTVAIFITELQTSSKKCEIETTAAVARCDANATLRIDTCKNACDASVKTLDSKLKMLESLDVVNKRRIVDLESRQTNTWLLLLGGAVGGALVTGIVVYTLQR